MAPIPPLSLLSSFPPPSFLLSIPHFTAFLKEKIKCAQITREILFSVFKDSFAQNSGTASRAGATAGDLLRPLRCRRDDPEIHDMCPRGVVLDEMRSFWILMTLLGRTG